MARAHAASPCVQSDSIKGLAQSIAKPAYHRLLTAEPALRRAVPTLIIAFLITICIGAFVQVIDQSRQKRASMKRDVSALADLLAERLDHIGVIRPDRPASIERLQRLLRSEEHTSELQSLAYLVCRLLLEKKKKPKNHIKQQNTQKTHKTKNNQK